MVQQADYHSVAEEGAQVEDVAERHRDEDGAVERQDEVIAVEQVWETQLGNTSLDIIETFSATKIAILLWSESRATSLLCQCRNDNNSWLIALQNYYCLVGRATGQNGGTFNSKSTKPTVRPPAPPCKCGMIAQVREFHAMCASHSKQLS